MTSRTVTKALIAREDLAIGQGATSQTRQGVSTNVNQIDLPWILTTLVEIETLNTTKYKHCIYDSGSDVRLYRYDATSAETADDYDYIDPTIGTGQWVRVYGWSNSLDGATVTDGSVKTISTALAYRLVEISSFVSARDLDLTSYNIVKTTSFSEGWAATTAGPKGGAYYHRDGTTGTASTAYSDNSGFYDSTGAGFSLADNQIRLPEMYGAKGDGVATAGVFSGTDDTLAIQSWLNNNLNLYADPDAVYVVGNITLPHHNGNDVHLNTNLTFAFANCSDTSYGMADQYHLTNSTSVIRGPKTNGNRWTLYGNDYVTTCFKGCMFDAEAYFVCSRALGDGFTLTNLRANGTTPISGTAVDNRLTMELHDNGGNGFRLIDSAANKITDCHLVVTLSEGNDNYDVNMDGAAGWTLDIERNYGSAGGVYIAKASAGTEVHFGQGDSGSISPSGTSGWGFFVSDIITTNSFDQASGFVKVGGHLNFAISCGGLSSGTGLRGIDVSNLHLNTEQGYLLLSQANPAIAIRVSDSIMSEESWTSIFGNSASASAPFRFSSGSITARYHISNTLVRALQNTIRDTKVDASGSPVLTISSGAITVTGGGHYLIDTEGAASLDDLDTINGLVAGESYSFSAANAGRTVVFQDGVDNIQLNASSVSLDSAVDLIFGVSPNGTNLICLPLGDNA